MESRAPPPVHSTVGRRRDHRLAVIIVTCSVADFRSIGTTLQFIRNFYLFFFLFGFFVVLFKPRIILGVQ